MRGNSARPAGIQRNRHLLGTNGRDSAPIDSVADCEEISSRNHENPGGSRARHPAGSSAKGRDSAKFRATGRNTVKSPIGGDGRAEFRTSRFRGRLCRNIFMKCCEISAVRGPSAREILRRRGVFRRHSARSAEIKRHLHLLGAKGKSSVPLDSAANCVEISSRDPEKYRRRAGPPSGKFCDGWARFRRIPPDLLKLSEISDYLGCKGGVRAALF